VVLSHLDIYTFWLTDIRPNNAKNLFYQIFLNLTILMLLLSPEKF